MGSYDIAVLPGDGIGPEIMQEGVKALNATGSRFGHTFNFKQGLVGGAAYDAKGHPLPEETVKLCDASQAIYFGAVGGPKWDNLPKELTPERGALLPLRKHFGLYANLRPAIVFDALQESSSLKQNRIAGGLDVLVVRELTGGIYFGNDKVKSLEFKDGALKGRVAYDVMVYSEPEIQRIARVAARAAMQRDKRLTSLDKANVLDTSILWREVVTETVEGEFPEVELDHLYIDNATMQIATKPKRFDVILAGNMFGDIASDESGAVTGSLGTLPSASTRDDGFGLYEPVHGSAPDIVGTGGANPIAQVLSGAMMLRHSFNLGPEANKIEEAVNSVLNDGLRTQDIYTGKAEETQVDTVEMGTEIAKRIAA